MYSRGSIIARVVYAFDTLENHAQLLGDLLVTVDTNQYSSREFNANFRSFQTHVLSKMFPSGLRVVTRSEGGRIHCHAAVALNVDASQFDWPCFYAAERWYKIYRQVRTKESLQQYKRFTKKFRESMPEELKQINRELKVKARNYGFGRAMVLPVRINNDALKWYLVKNVPRKRQERDKGVHYFASWGLPKASNFKVLSPRYNQYRANLRAFAQSLGLTAENYNTVLKEALGNNWHWQCREVIKFMDALPPHLLDKQDSLKQTIRQHLLRSNQES